MHSQVYLENIPFGGLAIYPFFYYFCIVKGIKVMSSNSKDKYNWQLTSTLKVGITVPGLY